MRSRRECEAYAAPSSQDSRFAVRIKSCRHVVSYGGSCRAPPYTILRCGRLQPSLISGYQYTNRLRVADFQMSLAMLSSEERLRCERLRREHDRRDYTAAHALLRRSLSHYAPHPPGSWQFVRDCGGKPRLADDLSARQLFFSLAHTRGFVACAIANVDLGIDAEQRSRFDAHDELKLAFLSAAELAEIARAGTRGERAHHCCARWTLKEAYAKATGVGLHAPMKQMTFELRGDSVHWRRPPGEDESDWQFRLFKTGRGYYVAVAVQSPRASFAMRQPAFLDA